MLSNFLKVLDDYIPVEQAETIRLSVDVLNTVLGSEVIDNLEQGITLYVKDNEPADVIEVVRRTLINYSVDAISRYGIVIDEDTVSGVHLSFLTYLLNTLIEIESYEDKEEIMNILLNSEDNLEAIGNLMRLITTYEDTVGLDYYITAIDPNLITKIYQICEDEIRGNDNEEEFDLAKYEKKVEMLKKFFHQRDDMNAVCTPLLDATIKTPFRLSISSLMRLYGYQLFDMDNPAHSFIYLLIISNELDFNENSLDQYIENYSLDMKKSLDDFTAMKELFRKLSYLTPEKAE